MLNLYFGNEKVNREKYIYESIRDHQKKDGSSRMTILIVPDQFSLQAEKNALKELGREALIDFMVADFSSLGHKVVKAAGIKPPELIDKYGRHMLLSVLIEDISEDLSVYRKYGGRNSFTAMTNQLISEMKRYGVTPEMLTEKTDSDKVENTYLKHKISDIEKIYSAYEEAIADKFIDSEDYILFYGHLMTESKLIKGSEIWIYGFDTFTPLNYQVIQKLMMTADSVNIVMTHAKPSSEDGHAKPDARALTTGGGEGIFDLTGFVMERLKSDAKEIGQEVSVTEISPTARLERKSIWDIERLPLTLVQTSNIYSEADRLVSWIMSLVRDEGYSFGDITVICNDMEHRGNVIRRTLEKNGIPVFADRKRGVLHQPLVNFIMALCDVVAGRADNKSIMLLVKSGMLGFGRQDEALLENYTKEYNIRSGGWQKPFAKGGDKYSEADLKRLNEMRLMIVEIIKEAKDEIGKRNTAEEKVAGLYSFLENQFDIKEHIKSTIKGQEELDLKEAAAETAQSWSMICSLLEQVTRIAGSTRISNGKLRDLIKAGLEEMEIGLVPVGNDIVIVGTMQRTRLSRTRALAVVGANEGVIPMSGQEAGILTERELDILEDMKLNISKRQEITRQEEQLAIYRTFSLPEDKLYVSCSTADHEGNGSLPSVVFEALRGICPEVEIAGDFDDNSFLDVLTTSKGTAAYMADAMRDYAEGEIESVSEEWLEVIRWFQKNDPDTLARIVKGMKFTGQAESLGNDLAEALYCGDQERLYVSASKLEKYSGCPFSYFVSYGLKADEQRSFEIDARDIGDTYHNCLMEFSKMLTPEGGKLDGEGKNAWMTMTEDQCREAVREILKGEAGSHREGIFDEDGAGRFRMECIEEICGDVAWVLVNQVKHSKIKEMHFEEPFGRNGDFEIELDDGIKACINGKIDRLDIIGEDKAVRVIDYKTGSNVVDIDHIRAGYKLQLMMYMNAAMRMGVSGEIDSSDKPAGVFYFKIHDYSLDASNILTPEENGKDPESALRKEYRMEGVMNDDAKLIEEMDTNLEGVSYSQEAAASDILPVKFVKKSGCYEKTGKSVLLTEAAFGELCRETTENVEKICRKICEGNIAAKPKREKNKDINGGRINACRFCTCKSICMFDTGLGCSYEDI